MAKLSLCVYSDPGKGKSTFIVELLDWLREHGLPEAKARIATVEHTGTYDEAVADGKVELWDMNTREEPFETVDAAAHGLWPEKNPENPKDKLIKTDFNQFPLLAIEGISTIADYVGGSYVRGGLASRSGRKERIGPAEETISFTDGGLAIGGNPRSHYNIVQQFIRGAVANSHKLPVYLVWTAHEQKAKDDKTGLPIVGPEVFGNKATQHVSRWFSNMIYLSSRPYDRKIEQVVNGKKEVVTIPDNEYFLWLKEHYEPSMPGIAIKARNQFGARNQASVPAFLPGGGLAAGGFMELLLKYCSKKEVK